jgi:alpha-glucosidase (family GH31 glycosyl hydrolase)
MGNGCQGLCLGVLLLCGGAIAAGSDTETAPPWPEWVHHHWVWENEGTRDSALSLVQGYLERDVPVGAVIIDSPWETGYNTFEFDPALYPDPRGMIAEFHAMEVRVLLWITSMINVDSPNYDHAYDAGYFLNQGRTIDWWKGEGSFIDYTNPEALDYWHTLMDRVLAYGIDGWKTDGTEFLTILLGIPRGAGGALRPRDYANLYYRDFFYYTRAQLGEERVIMSRPVDSEEGLFYWAFSPHDVLWAGWVGDQDGSFRGLRIALSNLFHSAWRGYVNIGSDIGGFGNVDQQPLGRSKEVLLRWAQMGALMPLMENGGSGEHRPWAFDEETLEIYRDFADLHESLLPYFMSAGGDAWAAGKPVVKPMLGTWNYRLGRDLFVAPMVTKKGGRWIRFPLFGRWVDWWNGEVHRGGSLCHRRVPLAEMPLYQREGSILPMRSRPRIPGLGAVLLPAGTPLLVVARPAAAREDAHYWHAGELRHATCSGIEGGGWRLRQEGTAGEIAWVLRGVALPRRVADSRGVLPERGAADLRGAVGRGWWRSGEDLWVVGCGEIRVEADLNSITRASEEPGVMPADAEAGAPWPGESEPAVRLW